MSKEKNEDWKEETNNVTLAQRKIAQEMYVMNTKIILANSIWQIKKQAIHVQMNAIQLMKMKETEMTIVNVGMKTQTQM